MTTGTASNFPQVSGPFVDKQGRIEQAWLQFLVSLWNRTGQSGSGPITGLEVGTGLIESQSGSVVTVAFGNIDSGNLLANIATDEAAAVGVTLTQYLDDVVGDTQGSLLVRGAGDWHELEPGSDEQVLVAHGPFNDLDWETRGNGTLYNVTDGNVIVNGVVELLFNGATVNDLGNGIAEIDINAASAFDLTVTDGTNTVNNVTELFFNGFNVTDLTGGEAEIEFPGGSGTVNEVSDGTNNLTNITEIYLNNTQFSVTANANPFIADVDFIGATTAFAGVLVESSTDIVLAAGLQIATWDTAVYDTGSFWSVGAPTRIVIPIGVSKVSFFAGCEDKAAAAKLQLLAIRKDGTVFNYSGRATISAASGFNDLAIETPPIDVVGGTDFFEMAVVSAAGVTLTGGSGPTYFGMRVIE